MKKFLLFILTSGIWIPAPVLGQTPITTDRLTAQTVEIVTPALNPVSQVSAFTVGGGGPATYYYWIVANFAQGNASPSNFTQVISAPNTLSVSNYIRVNWSGVPNATSYDVLRTVAPQLPNGAASIAVATGVTGVTTDDTGGALASYTINTLQPGLVSLRFQSPFANLRGSTAPPVSAIGEARFYYDLAASQMMLSVNGGAYLPFGSGAGSGITDINGLTATTQFFVTCSLGTDFNIQDSIDTHSLCIPDASATARGLVTIGAQVFGGNKTFDGDTLMDGSLYVTDFFSTDHPIEITGEACGTAEANVGLFGFDPVTGQPCFSYDGSTPSSLVPRLDQVLAPTADKTFVMGDNTLSFHWDSGNSVFDFTDVAGINLYSYSSDGRSAIGGIFVGAEFAKTATGIGDWGGISAYAGLSGSGGSSVDRLYALRAESNFKTAGTVTDNFGLYVQDQTAGTNNYSIFTVGSAPAQFGGNVVAPRFKTSGTALIAGDFVPDANWGASGSVAVTSDSTDQSFHITVTAAGAGQALNPTVAFTFHNGTWTKVPIYVCSMETGGTGALSFFTPNNTSATVLTLTYAGTPVVNLTYKIACNAWGIN